MRCSSLLVHRPEQCSDSGGEAVESGIVLLQEYTIDTLKQFQKKQNRMDTCTSMVKRSSKRSWLAQNNRNKPDPIRPKHPEHASYLAHAELALPACVGGSYSLAQRPHFMMHLSSCAC
jgi:hypothetical protein